MHRASSALGKGIAPTKMLNGCRAEAERIWHCYRKAMIRGWQSCSKARPERHSLFQVKRQLMMPSVVYKVPTTSQFKQRDTLLNRTPSYDEEVPSAGFGESAVAFGHVGEARESSSVEQVKERAVTSREALCGTAN